MRSPPQSLGCSVEEKIRAETTLCAVLSRVRTERGKRGLHRWQGTKPSWVIQTKSHRSASRWSEISVLTLSRAPTNRYTYEQDKWSSLFGFRKSKRKVHHSVCYVQQYCTVHFINEMLPATVQHDLNKTPLGHKEQQVSVSVGGRAEPHCCV